MDPQSARSPVHAEVFNPRYYTLYHPLGPQLTRPKVDLTVVRPAYLAADNSSLSCNPGLVDQSCLIDVAIEDTLGPTRNGLVYPPTHSTNIGYLECCNEHSNCQVQHHPTTPCATNGVTDVVTGLAKDGNQTSRANPSAASQKKSHVNGYDDCEPKECLYLGPDGRRCSKLITCATVSEHFTSHGIVKMFRREMIPCRWDGCSCGVVRHNFVRHIRERHLGHVRGSTTHSSEK